MSFLGTDQGDMATLEETLAFIESLEWGEWGVDDSSSTSDSNSVSSSSISVSQEYATSISSSDDCHNSPAQVDYKEITKQQPKKRQSRSKRKRSTLSSSTRLQQRKRAELLFLRRRAQEMEELLEKLKVSKRTSRALLLENDSCSMTEPTSTSMELAKVQYRARLQSEKVNRALKGILACQMNLSGSLKGSLKRLGAFEGMDFVCAQPPVFRGDFVAIGNQSSTLESLQRKASKLYLDSDNMYRSATSPTFNNATHPRVKSNNRKNVVEIALTAPVRCSMNPLSKLMWQELHANLQYPDKWEADKHSGKEIRHFASKPRETRKLSGLQIGCRFEEPGRTVFTLADIMVLTTADLKFYNHSWIVVTPSANDPLNSSVVHMRCQLSVDSNEDLFACAQDVRNIQELVLTDLCNRLRLHMQYVQNWLIEESERSAVTTAEA